MEKAASMRTTSPYAPVSTDIPAGCLLHRLLSASREATPMPRVTNPAPPPPGAIALPAMGAASSTTTHPWRQRRDALSPTAWARNLMEGTVLSCQGGVCTVVKHRPDLAPKIAGIPTSSPLIGSSIFTFENADPSDPSMTLNVARMALRPKEVAPFILSVAEAGTAVTVTQPHEDWPELDPSIAYVGVRAIMPPMDFADIIFNAWMDSIGSVAAEGSMAQR
jgi:hypothetical protein